MDMDNLDENIDDLREKLQKANAQSVRLSDYIARIINDNQRSTRMSKNKMDRLETNVKILEGQLELAVNEKFKTDEKLIEVEVQRDDFERELDQLKRRHDKQETKLQLLRKEIQSMNEQKKEFFAKFKRMRSQEMVHDAAVGALKRQFQDDLCEFSNEDASGNEVLALESTNAEAVPANVSDVLVVSQLSASTGENLVAGSTSIVAEQVNVDQPNGVDSHSMESISGRNLCQNVKSVMRGRTQVILHRLSMRKSSGTVIRRVTSTSTSTTSRVTRTNTVETHQLVEIKQQQTATERLPSQPIVERRSKRTLRCTLCSMPYVSSPTQALCGCQNRI